MTTDKKARRRKKWIAALIGVALALACQALPPDYRVPCQTVVQLCTGGLP